MMRKALVQHSSSLPESILCPALLRAKIALAGQWGGSERESVQGGFIEAAQVEMETHLLDYASL